MKKQKELYSYKILRYIIERYGDKFDENYTFCDSKLDSIHNNKAVISYRLDRQIGTDTWTHSYHGDEVAETYPIWDYKNKQITIDTSILNKAKYYEDIFNEYWAIIEHYRKLYYDCLVHKDPDNLLIHADFYKVEFEPIKFKSEEHRVMADEIYKKLLSEIENIKNKYNIKYIYNNLFQMLDTYTK